MSAATRPPGGPGRWSWLRAPEVSLALAILAVVGFIYVIDPGPGFALDTSQPRAFFSFYSLRTLGHNTALYGVLAVGVAVVIIAGGIDLSIGSVVALSAVVAARLMTDWLPGIGEVGSWTTGGLVASAAALALWTWLVADRSRHASGMVLSSLPAALIGLVAGWWLGGHGLDVGSLFVSAMLPLLLLGLVGLLRWGPGAPAAASVAAILWGLALALVVLLAFGAGGLVATVALGVAATALALLVGFSVGLRWGALGLATTIAGVVLWGLLTGEGTAGDRPLGLVVASIALSLLMGMAIGVGHAFLINTFQLPAFIATLATLAGLRSLATILSENRAITVREDAFRVLGSEYLVTIGLFLTVALILSVLMGSTILGRHLFALGGNEAAARLSGLPTRRLKTIAYAISGMLAALGGVLFAGNAGQADPRMGFAYELFAITAAVVGGCSLAGGVGTIRGTVLGLILIQIVIKGTGLVVEGIDPSQIEGLVLGIVVVLAVAFNQRFRVRQ